MTEDQNNNINKKEYLTHFIQVLEAILADLKLAITFVLLLLFLYTNEILSTRELIDTKT